MRNIEVNRRTALLGGAGLAASSLALPARLMAAAASSSGCWELLFNGVDLDDWTFFQEGVGEVDKFGAVAIEDGGLRMLGTDYRPKPDAGFGHLATKRSYADYHLRLDFRWGSRRFAPRTLAKRNSGLLYHMAPIRNVLYPDCVEFQFEEGDLGDAIVINARAVEGPNLGGTPVWPTYPPFIPRTYGPVLEFGGITRQWYRKVSDFEIRDGWNTIDLIAFDDQAAHLVNGRIVTTLFGLINKPVEGQAPVPLKSGRIALELEGAETEFRNIMIRSLSTDDITKLKKG